MGSNNSGAPFNTREVNQMYLFVQTHGVLLAFVLSMLWMAILVHFVFVKARQRWSGNNNIEKIDQEKAVSMQDER
jgi:hypothetical protein